jgi:hypothetical protein
MPTTGSPSGRLFIWYPHEDADEDIHIGHVSLYLGNYEVGRRFELSLDPNAPGYVISNDVEATLGARGVHYNENYVSWWPTDDNVSPAMPKLGLYADVRAERGEPHVAYDLYGLSVEKMRQRWVDLRTEPGAHYNFLRKNCADVVHRVLISGGVLGKLPLIQRGWFSGNLIATPKKVAQLANALRDAGWATKTKAGNCPTKGSVNDLLGPVSFLVRAHVR